jgi:hypothetical protein
VQVVFGTTEFNDGNGFNLTNNSFTAPSTGLYHIDAQVGLGVCPANATVTIDLSTSAGVDYTATAPVGASTYNLVRISTNIKLNANDVIYLYITNNATSAVSTNIFNEETRFSGYKVY